MKIYDRIPNIKQPTAVALGFFDGVHLGHKLIIKNAVSTPFLPIVFTFKTEWGLPDRKKQITRLFPYYIRHQKMNELGIDKIIEPEFIRIKNIEPEKFVNEILYRILNAKVIICGYDYRFGKNANGDIHLLRKLCLEKNIKLRIINPVKYLGEVISSSRIREALNNGKIPSASKMLGYDYFINFKVVEGNKLGRKIGYPTINQKFEPGIFIPKHGVYASVAEINGRLFPSITNIGVKPTFNDFSNPISETHILNFSSNLYGQRVKVILLDYIREQHKFSSFERLQDEIEKNIKEANIIHKSFIRY